MRGLAPEEKALLIRVGELVDGVINNRTPTNPFEDGRQRVDPRLPPPNTITHEPGIRTAKLSWNAVDSSILNHYKIDVTNLDNGDFESFTSFTNSFFFKGRIGGNYSAAVSSVGRGGTRSRVTTIEFFITEDVMLLEGSKNNFNTLGTVVSEDFYFTNGHKVFAWAAFTIDKLIGSASTGNTPASVRLYRGVLGQPIGQATLLQTITLFKATESATCLDTTALGGDIERPALTSPASEDLSFIRGTTFETAHSVMFAPIDVTDALKDKQHTIFLEVIGREVEDDVTGLSLTLWSANEGLASEIPADPFDPEPAIVTDDRKSVEIHVGFEDETPADQYMRGRVLPAFQAISDVWTFAMWIKFLRFTHNQQLFHRFEPVTGAGQLFNAISMSVTREDQTGTVNLVTDITIGSSTGSSGLWRHTDTFDSLNDSDEDPEGLYDDGQGPNFHMWVTGLNDWQFLTIKFDPVNGAEVRVNSLLKNPNSTDTTDSGVVADLTGNRDMIFGTGSAALYVDPPRTTYDGPTTTGITPLVARIHSAGLWNKRVPNSELLALYNGGNGVDGPEGIIHWRSNIGGIQPYNSSGSLVHYWQFGAESSALEFVGRDTGINQLGSGGNDGDQDLTDDGEINPVFTIAQNVVDDFPEV